MDNLFKTLIPIARRYPSIFLMVASHPRRFVERIDIADRNIYSGGMFLIVTCFFSSLLLNLLFFRELSLWWARTLACSIVLICSTLLCGIVMFISWRLVGYGRKDNEVAILYLYHTGIFNIFTSIIALLVASFIMEWTGLTAQKSMLLLFGYKESYQFSQTYPSLGIVLGLIMIITNLPVMVWGFAAWRAYKDIFKATWIRTIASLVIYCIPCTLIIVAFGFTIAAIYR